MKNVKKRKKRLRVGRLFIFLILLAGICYLLFKFVDIPIRSIIVKGNNILTDQEVIEEAKLDDYPSYFAVLSYITKKRLEKNPYIKKARVRKGLLDVKITIEEEKILYIKSDTKEKYSINNKIKDEKEVCAPYLIGDVPNDKKERFNKAMDKLDKDILCQMSDIKYDPNEIDKDRYYVNMNDGNSVYLTVNKFKKLNKYNTILENVGKQNGILYLDYGDYFKAK